MYIFYKIIHFNILKITNYNDMIIGLKEITKRYPMCVFS